ncbi:hypothetical protein BJX68DRAFT_243287 [Aspergillus pseudodeflectus]|uniref:KOW domain-containing protein n=1 Tax=Aspergillus pseudodeflectus TaxID=176178 RepID=A0ABR4JW42_9EURO
MFAMPPDTAEIPQPLHLPLSSFAATNPSAQAQTNRTMTFPEGTSVTFPVGNGEFNIGTVTAFEDGKYRIEVQVGEITELIEAEEADVKEFRIEMSRRDIFDYLK